MQQIAVGRLSARGEAITGRIAKPSVDSAGHGWPVRQRNVHRVDVPSPLFDHDTLATSANSLHIKPTFFYVALGDLSQIMVSQE